MKIVLFALFTFFYCPIFSQNNVEINLLSPKPSITIDGAPCNIGNTVYSCVPKTCNTVIIQEGDSIEFCTSTEIDLMIDSAYYIEWHFSGSSNFPITFTDSFPNATPICYSPIWNVAGNYTIDIYYNGWLSAYPTSDCWGFGPSHWIITVIVMPNLGFSLLEKNVELEVFPNPGKGVFNLTFSDEKLIQDVFVTTIFGETILRNENRNWVDLSNLPNGVYFLNVKTTNGIIIKKLVKDN